MTNRMLHTPEGVRDLYDREYAEKLILQERIQNVLNLYGYQPIQTPSFEFFDVFGKEVGTTPSKDLFKFFDREGSTLVLRPDITPSIARAAAKYFMAEEKPLRFSYLGNTFINNTSYQGRLKETTQIGGELLGDDSADADAEILAMTIESFLQAGIKEFQISVGHVGFYNAICEAAGIDTNTEETIRDFVCTKNYYAADEILEEQNKEEKFCRIFRDFSTFNGGREMLERARTYVEDIPSAGRAIDRLYEVFRALEDYGYEQYISFDLSFLSRYDYYTGIIFDGYTFGSGEAVAKGGRYDNLLSYFGKNSPAVGFVIQVDQLLTALSRQKIKIEIPVDRILLLYKDGDHKKAVREAEHLREEGRSVVLQKIKDDTAKEEIEAYAKDRAITEIRTI